MKNLNIKKLQKKIEKYRQYFMTNFKKYKSDILLCIGLLFLHSIWIGFAPIWYDWFNSKENCILIKKIYGVLDGCPWINIPICIIIIYVIYCWCSKIWKDSNLRIYRPLLAALGMTILFCEKSRVEYAKIFWNIEYRFFLTILLSIPLAISVIRLIKWIKSICVKKNQQIIEQKGFSNDNTSEGDISSKLKDYAKMIVVRLLNTDIKKQSYALGVTGEWGVGKTTFLRVIKDELGEKVDVVEFNPWMCGSPEQVTRDFFASLRHQLSPKYSRLSNPIKEYSRYIGNLNISPLSWASLDFLPAKKESLFEKKRKLSELFSELPNPVVVIMDDIDRLERDEVFEVLRLIRNTADLKNIIYIVAYDKEYVTCVLEEKNIKDASAYLEKIFPVEVYLPKVEEHLIWKALQVEINAQKSIDDDFTEKMFSKFYSDDKELILGILNNYRRVKRFARLYMLNIAYLNKHSKWEFNILDVFWLELLQMYDKKSYDVLADDEFVLLYLNEDKNRLLIRNGVLNTVNKPNNKTFVGEPFWKEETPKILDKIFGTHVRTFTQSVCYIENYNKYFTLSVSSFKLSIREMYEMLNAIEPEKNVENWIDSGKYFNSIIYQFNHVSVCKLDAEKFKVYIQGILCFAMQIIQYRNSLYWDVKKMLLKENFSSELKNIAHEIVVNWVNMKKEKGDTKDLLLLGRLLNKLYVTICYDETGKEMEIIELVISNNEIEDILVGLMNTYLNTNNELCALDVLKEETEMAYMFKNCCVCEKDYIAYGNGYVYKQLAYDIVIKHFASKEEKPTFEQYDDAYGHLFRNHDTPTFDNSYEENEYYYYQQERFENNMQQYFGSLYDKKLEEFKTKCFKESSEKEEDIKMTLL